MRTYTFKVIVEPDEGGYHAYCPALGRYGAATQGSSQEEALKNLSEVVQTIVDGLREGGTALPIGSSADVAVFEDARVAVTV